MTEELAAPAATEPTTTETTTETPTDPSEMSEDQRLDAAREMMMEDDTEEPKATEEAPVEEKPAEKKEPLSKAWSKLQKKEAEIQQVTKQINVAQQEIVNFQNAKAQIKQNPSLALQALGITLDQLTDYFIEGGKEPQAPDPRDQKIAEMERWKSQIEAERQATSNKSIVTNYDNQLNSFLASTESFPLVKALGDTEMVWGQVSAYAQKGTTLTPEQACGIVENYLQSLGNKVFNKSSAPPANQQQGTSDRPTPKAQTTLTNSMSTQPTDTRDMTDDERLQAARKLMESF